MDRKRIILSGGGTGGHIFPAISIARKLQEILPDPEILFVGARGKMEMEKVPGAGFKITGLPVSAFHRRLTLKNLVFPFRLVSSMIKSTVIIKRFKPDLAIGTGGFASGPILRAASKKGIPCLLQEQNAFPGITNRVLSKKVNKICVAYEGLENYFPKEKIIITGNPVREDIISGKTRRQEAMDYFSLSGDRPVVLIFGGSLGARTINLAIKSGMKKIAGNGLSMIWQTGSMFHDEAKVIAKGVPGDSIRVYDFIERMDLAYLAADVIVSRAGAISISELCLVGKPVILVPYPHAAGDHQLKNGKALKDKDAALLVPDHEAEKILVNELIRLITDKQLMNRLGTNIRSLAKPDATQRIAEEAIKLLK
jgi:UDP-N-acetylglucosamine--N-acetylmuramyl-(pentapeptide) pyrophosphoryl-undecaprenol N-acetylglucosamine transferase